MVCYLRLAWAWGASNYEDTMPGSHLCHSGPAAQVGRAGQEEESARTHTT